MREFRLNADVRKYSLRRLAKVVGIQLLLLFIFTGNYQISTRQPDWDPIAIAVLYYLSCFSIMCVLFLSIVFTLRFGHHLALTSGDLRPGVFTQEFIAKKGRKRFIIRKDLDKDAKAYYGYQFGRKYVLFDVRKV